jgi:hypothetical protein
MLTFLLSPDHDVICRALPSAGLSDLSDDSEGCIAALPKSRGICDEIRSEHAHCACLADGAYQCSVSVFSEILGICTI